MFLICDLTLLFYYILECEGVTFGLDCLQQCHCAPEACETERGLCKGQCIDSWIGPYCSQRNYYYCSLRGYGTISACI